MNMNRKYLARALKLGFNELCVYGPTVPVVCHDESRDFVWATLDAESAIPPAADAIRIESPHAGVETPCSQTRTTKENHSRDRTRHQFQRPCPSNGHAKPEATNGKTSSRKSSQQDIATLIEQAIEAPHRAARPHARGERNWSEALEAAPSPEQGGRDHLGFDQAAQVAGRVGRQFSCLPYLTYLRSLGGCPHCQRGGCQS